MPFDPCGREPDKGSCKAVFGVMQISGDWQGEFAEHETALVVDCVAPKLIQTWANTRKKDIRVMISDSSFVALMFANQ
jgi:hypothetical protein